MIDPKTDQMHITRNDLRIDVTSADKGDFVTEYAKQKNFEAAQNKGFWKRQLGSADICCLSGIAKYLWQTRHFDFTVLR